jgi:hypothetical protein
MDGVNVQKLASDIKKVGRALVAAAAMGLLLLLVTLGLATNDTKVAAQAGNPYPYSFFDPAIPQITTARLEMHPLAYVTVIKPTPVIFHYPAFHSGFFHHYPVQRRVSIEIRIRL